MTKPMCTVRDDGQTKICFTSGYVCNSNLLHSEMFSFHFTCMLVLFNVSLCPTPSPRCKSIIYTIKQFPFFILCKLNILQSVLTCQQGKSKSFVHCIVKLELYFRCIFVMVWIIITVRAPANTDTLWTAFEILTSHGFYRFYRDYTLLWTNIVNVGKEHCKSKPRH